MNFHLNNAQELTGDKLRARRKEETTDLQHSGLEIVSFKEYELKIIETTFFSLRKRATLSRLM